MKARIKFRKYGVMRFIGHLDVMRFFQKAMRRAGIPIAFTGGYSPHMIMSFALPLGVGISSDGEYLDIELREPIASEEAVRRLNAAMVEGMEVVSFLQIPDDKKSSGMTIVAASSYQATFAKAVQASWKEKTAVFLEQKNIVVLKRTKRSEMQVDIKPMIYQMRWKEGISLFLAAGSEQNLKPDLVIRAFLEFVGEVPDSVPVNYHRCDVYARRPEMCENVKDFRHLNFGQDSFVPLEAFGKEILL